MAKGSGRDLTDLANGFLLPTKATHRQYEALCARFVDNLSSAEAGKRFGYTPASFRVTRPGCWRVARSLKNPGTQESGSESPVGGDAPGLEGELGEVEQ